MRRLRGLGMLAMAVVLVGCGGDGGPTSEPPPTTEPTGGTEMDDPSESMLDAVAASAVADLAERLGIAEADVEVVTSEAVTWRDGALGCPEPGMAYTQALVPGHRVVLRVDGTEHHYHAGSDGRPFPCSEPQAPASGESAGPGPVTM